MGTNTLSQALATDLTLTDGQALAWFPGSHRVPTVTHWIGLTRHSTPRPTTFVCRDAQIAQLPGWQLRQLVGLAAARRLLGGTAQSWRVRAHLSPRGVETPIPDAIRDSPVGVVEVGYDAGTYSRQALQIKAGSYYSWPQVWVVATSARAATIRQVLATVLYGSWRVLVVDWLETPTPGGLGTTHRLHTPTLSPQPPIGGNP